MKSEHPPVMTASPILKFLRKAYTSFNRHFLIGKLSSERTGMLQARREKLPYRPPGLFLDINREKIILVILVTTLVFIVLFFGNIDEMKIAGIELKIKPSHNAYLRSYIVFSLFVASTYTLIRWTSRFTESWAFLRGEDIFSQLQDSLGSAVHQIKQVGELLQRDIDDKKEIKATLDETAKMLNTEVSRIEQRVMNCFSGNSDEGNALSKTLSLFDAIAKNAADTAQRVELGIVKYEHQSYELFNTVAVNLVGTKRLAFGGWATKLRIALDVAPPFLCGAILLWVLFEERTGLILWISQPLSRFTDFCLSCSI